MERVIILDIPRGRLSFLLKDLRKQGVSAKRYIKGMPPGNELAGPGLLGLVVHHKRAKDIEKLKMALGLANIPALLWCPANTSPKEIEQWSSIWALDMLVGPLEVNVLLARLRGYRKSDRARLPWLAEAVQTLMRVGRAVTSREDDLAVLSTTATELEKVFPGVYCSIMMLSPLLGSATVITQGGISEPLNISLDLDKYPEVKRMLLTRRPVAVKDVRKHPLMREVRNLLKSKDLFSILAVPIFYREQVIGLIMLRSSVRQRPFSKIEINFCEMVAQAMAVALRNVRLGREVTEEVARSKEAMRLARKSNSDLARMKALFEHASDGIVVVDANGRVKGVNTNFTNLAGYTKKDLAGKSIEYVLRPAAGESFSVARAIKAGKTGGEFDAKRSTCVLNIKNGDRKFVAARIEPLPKRREWLISMHDVTEERELEEALRRTKDFLENMIQSSMDAIIAADMNGTIIVFNAAAEDISGYDADEVIGKMNIVDLYAPGVARDIMNKLRSEEYGGKGKLETSYNAIINKSGEEVPINMSAAIIYEDDREVASVGIFQDLRERIQIEKELKAAQERLMNSQRKETIAALAGAASHQLNQPLTSILGYSELLRRVEKSLAKELPGHPAVSSLHNATEVVSQEAERMAEVVRKIGEITEYETTDYVGRAKILDLDRARGKAVPEQTGLLKALFQHMEEAVIIGGGDTVIQAANPAAVVLTGENPTGKSFTRYLSGIEYKRAMEAFNKLKEGPQQLELEVTLADGNKKKIKLTAFTVPETDKFAAVYSDVTEKKKLDEALRDMGAFYNQLMENTTLPLVAMDVDAKITFWNQAAEKLTGYSFEQVAAKTPEFLIKGLTTDGLAEHVRSLRKRGDMSGEIRLIHKSGHEIKAYHVDAVMRDEEGKAVGFMSMIFDISDRQAFEHELAKKTEQIAVMADIAEAIRHGLGLEEAIGGALRNLSRVLSLDLCAVTLLQEGADEIMVIGFEPEKDKPYKTTLRLYDDAQEVKKLLFAEEPVIFNDTSAIKSGFVSTDIEKSLSALKQAGLKSMVNYPLIFRDEVIGTLHIASHEEGRYTEADLDRIGQLAGPISMGLANARMFNQIQLQNLELSRRTRWMEELLRAGRGMDIGMTPEAVISALIKPYLFFHPRQHLSAWLLADDGNTLALAESQKYNDFEKGKKLNLNPELISEMKRANEAIELRLPDPGYEPLLEGAKTAFLVPLMGMESLLGVIVLESHHINAFREEEKVEVRVLASHIGGVLRNMNLYHDLDLALRFQRGLIEDANALILILDKDGRIVLVNNALQKLLGEPEENLVGKMFLEMFEKHLRLEMEDGTTIATEEQSFRKIIRMVNSGESLTNLRAAIFSSDGRQSRTVFNTSTITDREGDFQGFIAIGQNMTRFQELEQTLLQAEKLATVGQMAAGIAHDLSNPVTGIINAADMLYQKAELEPGSRELVAAVREESRRIEALAQNLMSYAKPSREEMFPLDLRQVVLESLSFSHYDLSRGKVVVDTQIPEGLSPVRGIKDQLQQVFINLLTNASHACAETGGGRVSIGAREEDGHIRVTVSDTGCGIPEENREKLFDPFFTTKPEGKGTGLGLLIVREIISRHNGTVSVESEPGKGSSFTVTLPLYKT